MITRSPSRHGSGPGLARKKLPAETAERKELREPSRLEQGRVIKTVNNARRRGGVECSGRTTRGGVECSGRTALGSWGGGGIWSSCAMLARSQVSCSTSGVGGACRWKRVVGAVAREWGLARLVCDETDVDRWKLAQVAARVPREARPRWPHLCGNRSLRSLR